MSHRHHQATKSTIYDSMRRRLAQTPGIWTIDLMDHVDTLDAESVRRILGLPRAARFQSDEEGSL